jgi:FSR family fosmidomycin resistance protein-like MFS transporter
MKSKSLLTLLSTPVVLLASGHLVADLYSGFIFPILPYLAKRLDISLPMAGLIVSLSGLSSSFLQPIYGYFSDKISRRFFVVWGLIIASIFISLTGMANTYWMLAFFVIVGNIGVGLYHPQATAIVGKLKETSKNFSMGIFVAGGIIGYALGPMLSSSIVEFLGLRWTPIAAIPGIILVVTIYLFLPKLKFERPKINAREVLSYLYSKKTILLPIILIVIIRSFILMSMSTYFPFEWEDNLGYSVLTVGIVMAIFSLTAGISSIIGGALAEKYGEKRMLILSFILPFPLLLLALYFMKDHGILSFTLYIIGGALLESTIAVNIVLAQRVVSQYMGIISGITGGFCWGIAGFLMFPLGLAISKFGMYPVVGGVMFLALVAIILVFLIPREVFQKKETIHAS